MFRAKHLISLILAAGAIVALAACAPFTTITSSSGTAPTPVVAYDSPATGSAAPAREWKTYRADSGYEIRYPLDAYSVRDTGRPSLDAARIMYPGAKVVEPNDGYVYQNAGLVTHRITLAVVNNDHNWSLDDNAEQLLAENPIAPYNRESLADHPVQRVSFAGQPALRVDGVTEGPLQITTQLVAIRHGLIFYLLVEPHDLPPNQAEAYQPKVDNGSDRALLEEILASFAFTGE